MPAHRYRLFGLTLSSEITLPELASGDDQRPAEVVISRGRVEAPPAEAGQHPTAIGERTVIAVPGVARYAVAEGARIIVDPAAGTHERDVRLYLLGSAMGLLLHQRGLLPLHANAVEADGRAAAFMGPSGAGKSTLAAWFHDQGLTVLADDVCVVRFGEDGRAVAMPGLARVRLWQEALELGGRSPADHPLSFSGDAERRKYDVTLDRTREAGPVPLGTVYLLEQSDAFAIERLSGLQAAEAVFANTYRGAYVAITDGHRAHWEACVALVTRVPVYRVVRRWGFDAFEEQSVRLLAHLRDV